MIADQLARLVDQAISGPPLSREQAEWLVSLGRDWLEEKLRAASLVRERFFGRKVRCCSIVAAKLGRCSQDCAFCAQSARYRTHVRPARLTPAQVLRAAHQAAGQGAVCFGVVNSGLGPSDSEIEYWADTFRGIAAGGQIGLSASLGVLRREQAVRLAQLGVRRYNHNLETSRRYYPRIVSSHSYEDRLTTLGHVQAAGLSLCSGGIFGLGETWEDRLDLAFELRRFDPDVIPLNFLHAIPGTPLANMAPLDPDECLEIIVVYRFLFPRAEIKVAGGREAVLGSRQARIFQAGASGFLIGNYLTTTGQPPEADHKLLLELGLEMERHASSESGAFALACESGSRNAT